MAIQAPKPYILLGSNLNSSSGDCDMEPLDFSNVQRRMPSSHNVSGQPLDLSMKRTYEILSDEDDDDDLIVLGIEKEAGLHSPCDISAEANDSNSAVLLSRKRTDSPPPYHFNQQSRNEMVSSAMVTNHQNAVSPESTHTGPDIATRMTLSNGFSVSHNSDTKKRSHSNNSSYKSLRQDWTSKQNLKNIQSAKISTSSQSTEADQTQIPASINTTSLAAVLCPNADPKTLTFKFINNANHHNAENMSLMMDDTKKKKTYRLITRLGRTVLEKCGDQTVLNIPTPSCKDQLGSDKISKVRNQIATGGISKATPKHARDGRVAGLNNVKTCKSKIKSVVNSETNHHKCDEDNSQKKDGANPQINGDMMKEKTLLTEGRECTFPDKSNVGSVNKSDKRSTSIIDKLRERIFNIKPTSSRNVSRKRPIQLKQVTSDSKIVVLKHTLRESDSSLSAKENILTVQPCTPIPSPEISVSPPVEEIDNTIGSSIEERPLVTAQSIETKQEPERDVVDVHVEEEEACVKDDDGVSDTENVVVNKETFENLSSEPIVSNDRLESKSHTMELETNESFREKYSEIMEDMSVKKLAAFVQTPNSIPVLPLETGRYLQLKQVAPPAPSRHLMMEKPLTPSSFSSKRPSDTQWHKDLIAFKQTYRVPGGLIYVPKKINKYIPTPSKFNFESLYGPTPSLESLGSKPTTYSYIDNASSPEKRARLNMKPKVLKQSSETSVTSPENKPKIKKFKKTKIMDVKVMDTQPTKVTLKVIKPENEAIDGVCAPKQKVLLKVAKKGNRLCSQTDIITISPDPEPVLDIVTIKSDLDDTPETVVIKSSDPKTTTDVTVKPSPCAVKNTVVNGEDRDAVMDILTIKPDPDAPPTDRSPPVLTSVASPRRPTESVKRKQSQSPPPEPPVLTPSSSSNSPFPLATTIKSEPKSTSPPRNHSLIPVTSIKSEMTLPLLDDVMKDTKPSVSEAAHVSKDRNIWASFGMSASVKDSGIDLTEKGPAGGTMAALSTGSTAKKPLIFPNKGFSNLNFLKRASKLFTKHKLAQNIDCSTPSTSGNTTPVTTPISQCTTLKNAVESKDAKTNDVADRSTLGRRDSTDSEHTPGGTRRRVRKGLLSQIANTDGYVAESKVHKSDTLLADPSQLSREERALQRAIMQFGELEMKNAIKTSSKACERSDTTPKTEKLENDAKEKEDVSSKKKSERSRDFRSSISECPTRRGLSARRGDRSSKPYHKDNAYEREISREEERSRRLRETRRKRRISQQVALVASRLKARAADEETPSQLEQDLDQEIGALECSEDVWEISDSKAKVPKKTQDAGRLMLKLCRRSVDGKCPDSHHHNSPPKLPSSPAKSSASKKNFFAKEKVRKSRMNIRVCDRKKFYVKSITSGHRKINSKKLSTSTSRYRTELDYQGQPSGSNRGDDLSDLHMPAEVKRLIARKTVGETVLHRAARLGYEESVRYCLANEIVDVNAKDNAGYTALHESCVSGNLNIARDLITCGAIVNSSAHGGTRPIHDAVEHDHVELVRLLLSYGADPTLATYADRTPLSVARSPAMTQLITGVITDLNGPGLNTPESVWEFPSLRNQGPFGFDVFADCPDDSDCEHVAECFTSCAKKIPVTYNLRLGKPETFGSYMLLRDVLNATGMNRSDFLTLHDEIRMICVTAHEFSQQLRTSQIIEVPVTSPRPHVELLEVDHNLRSVLKCSLEGDQITEEDYTHTRNDGSLYGEEDEEELASNQSDNVQISMGLDENAMGFPGEYDFEDSIYENEGFSSLWNEDILLGLSQVEDKQSSGNGASLKCQKSVDSVSPLGPPILGAYDTMKKSPRSLYTSNIDDLPMPSLVAMNGTNVGKSPEHHDFKVGTTPEECFEAIQTEGATNTCITIESSSESDAASLGYVSDNEDAFYPHRFTHKNQTATHDV